MIFQHLHQQKIGNLKKKKKSSKASSRASKISCSKAKVISVLLLAKLENACYIHCEMVSSRINLTGKIDMLINNGISNEKDILSSKLKLNCVTFIYSLIVEIMYKTSSSKHLKYSWTLY